MTMPFGDLDTVPSFQVMPSPVRPLKVIVENCSIIFVQSSSTFTSLAVV